MEIELRELRRGDIALVTATDGGPAWDADAHLWERYLEEQSRSERVILLALHVGEAVAYGTLAWVSGYEPFRKAEIPEINNLVVAASAWRQGIATKFIAEFERRSREAARAAIGVGVGLYADYGPAQRLYAKLGYRPDGRGITYHNRPVTPGASFPVNDDLVLWMTKAL